MDQRNVEHEKESCTVLQCQNIEPGTGDLVSQLPSKVHKPEHVRIKQMESNIVSLTPDKTKEHKRKPAELPEKYIALVQLFDRLICSWRLLTLLKKQLVFQNISKQVEVLSGRKFSYKQLAQIIYLVPDVVRIDRALIHDNERTLCRKEDLKISLLFDAIECEQENSPFAELKQLFSSRLLNFSASHPEDNEIPEAVLPLRFNKESISANINADLQRDLQSSSTETESLTIPASHICPSFSRNFSLKMDAEVERTDLKSLSLLPPDNEEKQNSVAESIQKEVLPDTKSSFSESFVSIVNVCENTPIKSPSKDCKLQVETPSLVTPRRTISTTKCNIKTSANRKSGSALTKRSLIFSEQEAEESNPITDLDDRRIAESVYDTVMDIMHRKGSSTEDNPNCEIMHKAEETKSCTEKVQKMNKQMSSSLFALVTLIYDVFQSVSSSTITKGELVHKMVMNDLDIIDNREAEEKLEVLEKLAPDWICSKSAPSGDLLYSIKKASDLSALHVRLTSM